MKHLILATMLAAVPLAAMADSTSTTECWREGLRRVCASEYKSPHATSRTECYREPGRGLTCETTSKRKPVPEPERPVLAPSVERSGAGPVVIRGMSR